jgi:hypothetical protein
MSIPGQTTLATVRTLIRQLTGKENSQSVTDAELNSYINLDYQELYGILVTSFADNYFLSSYQFKTDGASLLYPLPPDFFKLRGVDLSLTNTPNSFVTLKPFNFSQRNRLNNSLSPQTYGMFQNVRYQINGSNLMLTPLAQAGLTIQLWYVPRLVPLALDADVLDGVNGWEQYVIASVCCKVLAKEETDYSAYASEKQFMLKRIQDEAANRNAGDATTVTDVYDTGWEF